MVHGLELLEHYCMIILPALMVAEQFGLPTPAVPALMGVGALAARGRVNVALLLRFVALSWARLPKTEMRPNHNR